MKYFISFLGLLLFAFNGQSQCLDIEAFPNKELRRKSRIAVKGRLEELSDSLSLTWREKRLRKFLLTCCNGELMSTDQRSMTPAGDFPKLEGCPAQYVYKHITSRRGSHYKLDSFLDKNGNLIDTGIFWTLVVH